MAKIPGIIYLIIGIFVAVASYEISYNKLYFFFYIGLIFIVYGVARIVIEFINKGEEKKVNSPNMRRNQLNQVKQTLKQQYKRCPNCGNVARGYDNFCARCGNKLY